MNPYISLLTNIRIMQRKTLRLIRKKRHIDTHTHAYTDDGCATPLHNKTPEAHKHPKRHLHLVTLAR